MIELTVSADAAGQRLDKYVRRALRDVPLSHVYKMFRTKKIRVNGLRGRAEQLLAEGDKIAIRGDEERLLVPAEGAAKGPRAARRTFGILHEDEHLLVVDKPAGLAAHPGSGIEGATLVDEVRAHLRVPADLPPGEFKPSPAHRLDRDTSGVVLVAKTRKAMVRLGELFTEGDEVRKAYLALAKGKFAKGSGVIDLPLSEHEQTSRSKDRRGRELPGGAHPLAGLLGQPRRLAARGAHRDRPHPPDPAPPPGGRPPGRRRPALRRLLLQPRGARPLGPEAHVPPRLEARGPAPGDRRPAPARGAAAGRAGGGPGARQPRGTRRERRRAAPRAAKRN